MKPSIDIQILDKRIQDYTNKISQLRREISTFNIVNESLPSSELRKKFIQSDHYQNRLKLSKEITNFETIEKNHYFTNHTVFKKIDKLFTYARLALRQKYESL